jgi:hypothetical protein
VETRSSGVADVGEGPKQSKETSPTFLGSLSARIRYRASTNSPARQRMSQSRYLSTALPANATDASRKHERSRARQRWLMYPSLLADCGSVVEELTVSLIFQFIEVQSHCARLIFHPVVSTHMGNASRLRSALLRVAILGIADTTPQASQSFRLYIL